MNQSRDRGALFVAMALAVPCPCVFLFCGGLLSVSGLTLVFVSFARVGWKDPVALVFAAAAIVQGLIYGAFLYWFSGFLLRRLSTSPVLRGSRARGVLLAALFAASILPVYSFDCMDGASLRWCNWYELHSGWFGITEKCGDFHW